MLQQPDWFNGLYLPWINELNIWTNARNNLTKLLIFWFKPAVFF